MIKVGEKMKKLREFFDSVKKEMNKVRWPNKKELMTYSIATLAFILIFALFFTGTDFILATIKTLLGK